MKIAINAQQLSQLPLDGALDVARTLGVRGVEIWPENVPGGDDGFRWRGRNAAAAGELAGLKGLEVACVTLGFFALPRAVDRSDAIRSVVEALDAGLEAGASLVNVYLAGVPGSEFIEIMRPAVAEAEARGVTIVLENEAHDDSAFPEAVRDILDAVGSPWLRTQYDPCNYYHAGVPAFPLPLEVLGERIAYLHLKGGGQLGEGTNLHPGSPMRDSSQPIGYGPIRGAAFDLEGVVRAMRAQGYGGWATLEPHVGADAILEVLREDLDWLRHVLGKA